MPMICPAATPPAYTLEVDLNVTAAGSPPAYAVVATNPGDAIVASHLKNTKGDVDFSDTAKPVAVIVHLKDASGIGLRFDDDPNAPVFSFAKDYGGPKSRITRAHYQIRNVVVTDGTTVSLCYRNTQNDDDHPGLRHRRSQYGLNFLDPKQHASAIDPGVGNGANK